MGMERLLILMFLACAELFGAGARREPVLSRTDLLSSRDADGRVQRTTNITEWQQRRRTIVSAMQEIMGGFPGAEKRCPLDPNVEEEVDCGDYVRRRLTYQSEPGSRTPAYLLIPKRALNDSLQKFPAALSLHPTSPLGHQVVVGLGDNPNHAYADELVRRGFVTIAPAYPLMAEYHPNLQELGYASGTMKAIWDNVRALDLLESLPFVQRDAFGAIGHSLGGHNAIYTAVFDPRIKVIVSSCGFDSYLDYYSGDPKVWQKGKGWTQERYIPRLAEYAGRLEEIPFDFHELIAALAPRRIFINAPLGDSNFQWRSVDRVIAAARSIYELHAAADRLEVMHPDCAHDFPKAMRERAYQLLETLKAPASLPKGQAHSPSPQPHSATTNIACSQSSAVRFR